MTGHCHIGSQRARGIPTQEQVEKPGGEGGVGGAGPSRMKMWSSPGRDLVAYLLGVGPGIQAHRVLEHLVLSAWLSVLPTCQRISSHCSRCRASFTWPPSFVHKAYKLKYVGSSLLLSCSIPFSAPFGRVHLHLIWRVTFFFGLSMWRTTPSENYFSSDGLRKF